MAWRTAVVVVLLACAVTTTLAAVAIGPAETHPKHEGKCWSSSLGQAFGDGQSWQEEGACVRMSCNLSHRGSLVVQYSTCGAVAVDPPCHVEKGDVSLPYPKCCYNIVCPPSKADPISSSSSSSFSDQKPTGIDHDALLLSPEEAEKDKEYEEFYNWVFEYYDYYDKPGAVV
ncbi:short spindle 7 [Oratosquilla oratoria]|uniref:short spindle 7 n=1 Tax=Oratosquilla oratoria TaxID=337810 RepID=UPI003F769F21